MEHEQSKPPVTGAIDGGRNIDWGKTSRDYASYRPGPPASFYEVLHTMRIGLAGQRILDLGTGTGTLARHFATRGAAVTGIDIAAHQIEEARLLAMKEGSKIEFLVGRAEETGLPSRSFDVIMAFQSWLYFKRPEICREVQRLLADGGRLVTGHFCWLPRLDPVARRSEELVLQYNPHWSAADFSGDMVVCPSWSKNDFRVSAMFFYDEPVEFTRESWRGRIRACRGIGATLPPEEVERFDRHHDQLLRETAPETFTILHRIDCHVFEPL